MNKIYRIVLLVLLVLSISGCDLFEQKEDIIIMYTNDVASALNGDVGYAGVKGYKNYLESENNYVSLVDAGDYFDGDVSQASKGKYIVDIMNAVGYDVVALGNQEFSGGLDALSENIANSNFKYVSCNLNYVGSGKNVLSNVKPYVIKRYGWTKVAFIGVTTPETLTEGKPSYEAVLDENGNLLYDFYGDNDGLDLYEQVQKTVDKVRNRVDYVIVLAHLGSNSVTEGFSSYDLIDNTSGIDVVIDGHSHTVISGEGVYNKDGEMVVLTSTGKELENLGVLTMHPDHSFTTVLYPSVYEKDNNVQAMIDQIYTDLNN